MVFKTSSKTDSMAYVFHIRIEKILLRIKAIQKSYKQINNVNLKIRLLKEYEVLKINFFQIQTIVKLIDNSSSNKLSISKLLSEECNRCENEVFKDKYLFSA